MVPRRRRRPGEGHGAADRRRGTAAKRFVLRYPESGWNGSLVIGAHGGSGGNNFDPDGQGHRHRRDGARRRHRPPRRGVAVRLRQRRSRRRHQTPPAAWHSPTSSPTLAAGRSRAASAGRRSGVSAGAVDGRRHRAGCGRSPRHAVRRGGHRRRRRRRPAHTPGAPEALAALWPDIDPRTHPGLSATDPKVAAFAEAIGTPVAARRLWPYTAPGAVPRRLGAGAGAARTRRRSAGAHHRGRRHVGRLRDRRAARLPRARQAGGAPPAVPGRGRLAHVGRRRRRAVVPVRRVADGARSRRGRTPWARAVVPPDGA